MIPVPDPLHPAVVHFPVALLLVGGLLAWMAVIWRRWALPAALILSLGAAGAIVAVETGEREADRAGELSGAAAHLLDEHAEAGETVRTLGVVTAGLAIFSALLGRFLKVAKVVALLCAVASLAAGWQVAKAGHYGGQMVYHQGVGIREGAGLNVKRVPAASSRGAEAEHH